MPDAGLDAARPAARSTRRSAPASPARSSSGRASTGLDPHVNHLERFILRADDPHADDYTAFMGARAELVADLAGLDPPPGHEGPRRRRAAAADRARAARRARGSPGVADVTISHPRFLEFVAPGRLEGSGRPLAGPAARVPLGATLAIGDQWNDLEMLAEVGPRGGDADARRPAVQAVARYVAPPLAEEGVAADDRGARAGRAARPRRAAAALADEARRRAAARGAPASAERSPPRAAGVTARIVPDDAAGRAAAVEVLRAGGVVALPTDTVYGIAVALDTPGGIERLFAVKRRPPGQGDHAAARRRRPGGGDRGR